MTFVLLIILSLGCADEEELDEGSNFTLEIGKPIEFKYDPTVENSFEDTYYGMDLAFYIPPGIEELKNRPLLYTLSTRRNRSVSGSLLPIIQKHGMIAVSPMNGNSAQFEAFFEALIETEYIDSSETYMSGFSNGGRDIYQLAWSQQDKVKGVILLDPSDFFSGEPLENSKLSICIVCQDDRIGQYEPDITSLNELGIKSKMIAVEGLDHFGILSSLTIKEKTDCFEFVSEGN
ncbi:hypothetical protein [Reichenbachiella sp.]|uniref:hypothetical protein n=1 Tax=Reichenbachiella sp. TaxID=2184521 RepID=UPI0032981190